MFSDYHPAKEAGFEAGLGFERREGGDGVPGSLKGLAVPQPEALSTLLTFIANSSAGVRLSTRAKIEFHCLVQGLHITNACACAPALVSLALQ